MSALISAADGWAIPFVTSVSRNTAAHPATSGVAMLVPLSKKKSGSDELPNTFDGLVTARDSVDRMHVPGATTSGLIRRSRVGPRLEKATSPSGSSAWRSEFTGSAGKSDGQYAPYVGAKSE